MESKCGSCVVSHPSLNSPKTKLKEIGVLNPGIESVGKAQKNMKLTALGSPKSVLLQIISMESYSVQELRRTMGIRSIGCPGIEAFHGPQQPYSAELDHEP